MICREYESDEVARMKSTRWSRVPHLKCTTTQPFSILTGLDRILYKLAAFSSEE
jgi:hypothetical protein